MLQRPINAKKKLISVTFIKSIALIINTNLKGKFKRVMTRVMLVSILFLLVCVRISIISVIYPVKIKAECIQFFAWRNRIHPIVVVEDTRIILLGLVRVKSCITENKVPKISSEMVLWFIIWISIRAPGSFWKVVAHEKARSLICSMAVISQKWKGATANLIINSILINIPW